MGNKILNQWSSNNCANYALIAILQHKWIIVPDELFLIDAPYIGKLEKLFREAGLIKKFIPVKTTKQVDRFLRLWEKLITCCYTGNFSNPPNITFDWKVQHFFVIVEDLWDKYKCQNSEWEDWWDKWYFYINKSYFRFLLTPRRVIV